MTPLVVLNPGGRDATRHFPSREGIPSDAGHAPVNYHAYAACVGSAFYRDDREIPDDAACVLVLLRRDLRPALRAIGRLKKRGIRSWISWKESGSHQVAEQLASGGAIGEFENACAASDGFLSSTPSLVQVYKAAGSIRGCFVPTPYPVESSAWDFSLPFDQRAGIFVGTREFDVPSRNHLAALLIAAELAGRTGCPLTVLHEGGRHAGKILQSIKKSTAGLTIVEGRRPYCEYLRLIAKHRLVFQLDRSHVPGQVAGDALLCRVPCVGGDGAVDRLAFGELCGPDASFVETAEAAERLLRDDAACKNAIRTSQDAASRSLSFSAVRAKLEGLVLEGKRRAFGTAVNPRVANCTVSEHLIPRNGNEP